MPWGLSEVAAPPRHEARDKVTGAAQYTVDVRLPDQGSRPSSCTHTHTHTHRKVCKREIEDWTQALGLPGVAGAVDMMNGATMVRFAGQEIAAIAATDLRTAVAALQRVTVESELSTPAIGMAAARAPTRRSCIRR